MTSPSGLKRGLTQGLVQGVKSGTIYAKLQSGLKGGLKEDSANKGKIQDPASLSGFKTPWIYANADSALEDGTYTYLPDIADLETKWVATGLVTAANFPTITYSGTKVILGSNGSGANRPYIKTGLLGSHNYLDFGGSSGSSAAPWLSTWLVAGTSGYSRLEYAPINPSGTKTPSITVMMVLKSKEIASKTLFTLDGSTQPGGMIFNTQSVTPTDTLRLIAYGNIAGAIRTSSYDTTNLPELNDWVLVTMKMNLLDPNKAPQKGLGSEQELYVNGKFQHTLVTNTWGTFSATPTIIFPINQQITIGSNNTTAGTGANGMYLASFLMLPYWANETEQLRLENYFRYYYGMRF